AFSLLDLNIVSVLGRASGSTLFPYTTLFRSGDHLGDRVLDLDAGVDLEEGDGAVLGDDEFHRARAGVAGLAADLAGTLVDGGVLLIGQERRRGLLDELLEAALHRAVTGADDADIAVGICQHLGLDVARLGEELLHVALAATEGCLGLAARGGEALLNVCFLVHDLQATAATTEGRLDGDRHAVLGGEVPSLLPALDRLVGAGGQRGADLGGQLAGRDLIAQGFDGLRGGADPHQPGVLHRAGEVRVFGEEAVARVHAIHAAARRNVQQRWDVHVGI